MTRRGCMFLMAAIVASPILGGSCLCGTRFQRVNSQGRVIYSSTPVKRLLWDCGLSDDRAEARCGAIDETEGGMVIRVTRALQRLA